MAVIVCFALASASGAATTKAQKVSKINVSTRAAVVHYLRSIHVNAKHVVIQRGLRNYAGAHCPGKGWTCAGTRHTVVQIAKRGGLNRFACTTAKCAVVQFGGASPGLRAVGLASKPPKPPPAPNYALCVKTTGITQSCVINQPNASGQNKAVVWMVTPKMTGLTQSASYSASITQGPASAAGSSNNNLACVKQFVWIDGSTTKTSTANTTITNDNHELITINQNSLTGTNTVQGAVPPSGPNTYDCGGSGSQLQQDEQLTSVVNSRGSITQKQNTLPSTTSCTKPPDAPGCANVVTDIEQNQGDGFKGFASGLNNANFAQSTKQVAIANTPKGTVIQQQNANVPAAPYSGIVGTINQDSTAKSTAVVNQDEKQCQAAVSVATLPLPTTSVPTCPVAGNPGVPSLVTLTQTQWGPEGVGVLAPSTNNAGRVHYYHKGYGKSEQTGAGTGVVDSFQLTQTSNQSADQTSGQKNTMQGDCKSSGDGSATGGSCQASQTATANGGDTQDGYTAGEINQLLIHCISGALIDCTATPPPTPVLTVTPADPSEDTNPAFEWTEGGSGATVGISFDCSIDSGTPAPCDSGDTFPVGLGPHTFDVTASDNFGHTSDAASWAWTVVPYLTFEATDDDASAGWSGTPGAFPITLVVGNDSGTYAQFTLHNFEGIAIGDLPAEPTFDTDTFSGGAPRYEIDLDNGDYLFGYPSNAPYGRSWDIVCGHVGCTPLAQGPWSAVQTTEGTATITAVLVEADWPPGASATYNISDFLFDGYALSFFGNHWH